MNRGECARCLLFKTTLETGIAPQLLRLPITSQQNKARLPTHIEIEARTYGLSKNSVVLLEQIRTLDKKRLRERMGCLDEPAMSRVDSAIAVSFGLKDDDDNRQLTAEG